MRFTTINTTIENKNKTVLKDKSTPLEITANIEDESYSRYITINISPDIEIEGFNIWLDLDIYQAELFGKKILKLVENRKQFLNLKMKED